MLRIYNTLSGEKEQFPSSDEQKKIRMFVCGPTVYDYSHIGHARTYIVFDFLAKFLRSQGYDVTYLQNITDIDDKIIKRAREEKKDPLKLSEEFTKVYLDEMSALGIEMTADEKDTRKSGKILYAPATKFITQIAAQVERLIDKGFAYKIDGDGWYFDISKDDDYGKLSHRTAEQAEDSTSRIDESVDKRNKGDFCLWKFSKPDEPSWKTSLGAGRPGWHIEDTAISEFYFGPQYEIHGGGVDLKFPHHEAEIAQQESASGLKPFVQTWMHTGALLVDGKKMSKSLGNFITIRDFLKKYPAEVLRWITLTHHYRSPIDYSDEAAEQAKSALETIKKFVGQLEFIANGESDGDNAAAELIIKKTEEALAESLADDVNTPAAIANVFGGIADIQPQIWQINAGDAATLARFIKEKLKMFDFSYEFPEIPKKIAQKAAEREQFRSNKQFAQSDALRKEINDLGYDIEDTPRGSFVWPQSQLLWHPKNHS